MHSSSFPQLTYGITPPKLSTAPEKRAQLAARQVERIQSLGVDALVVYDLQDESTRTQIPRPFPFMQAVDPCEYACQDLQALSLPKIVYRSVAKLDPPSLKQWLKRLSAQPSSTVFVGAPSRSAQVTMRLDQAYEIYRESAPPIPLGGVAIAERHRTLGGEDTRMLSKMAKGCSFFISQAVYDVTATKNLLSDLHYRCAQSQTPMPHILVTICPCGSAKTLEFLRWLGIEVPQWLQNELKHAPDMLQTSVDNGVATFGELWRFAQSKGFSLGCNVESVSVRKTEIDAASELVHKISDIMGRAT